MTGSSRLARTGVLAFLCQELAHLIDGSRMTWVGLQAYGTPGESQLDWLIGNSAIGACNRFVGMGGLLYIIDTSTK